MSKDQRSNGAATNARGGIAAKSPSDGRFRAAPRSEAPRPLDATNRRILAELQEDGRVSLAELGRRIGLSPPAVGERLAALEADGTIRGYRAELDPRRLGLALTAVIRIRPAPGQLDSVAAAARETPEVVACDRITGEDCYLLRAHLHDVDHLERVIDRFTPLGQTTTSIVQSSAVGTRPIALEG